jgi:hypothetical protein
MPHLEQRRNIGILEDFNHIGKFSIHLFGTKDRTYEIP